MSSCRLGNRQTEEYRTSQPSAAGSFLAVDPKSPPQKFAAAFTSYKKDLNFNELVLLDTFKRMLKDSEEETSGCRCSPWFISFVQWLSVSTNICCCFACLYVWLLVAGQKRGLDVTLRKEVFQLNEVLNKDNNNNNLAREQVLVWIMHFYRAFGTFWEINVPLCFLKKNKSL